MVWRSLLLLLLLLPLSQRLLAMTPFVVNKIEVEGLQRITLGTIYNYLPLQQGDRLDAALANEALHALYKTGFFNDVALERDGNNLLIFVTERPAIESITFEGNDAFPSEDLTNSLKGIGLSEGRIFNRSLLDRVSQELKLQYLSMGKYGVGITSEVKALERNRVAITIKIDEGEVAKIRHLNLVGNHAYSDAELLARLESGEQALFGLFSDRDDYAKQKLTGDLEKLRSWYMDRGYIRFDISSTQVSITPDKESIYVTVNLSEGEQYRVSQVRVSGDTVLPVADIEALITLKAGETFSRKEVASSNEAIAELLGDVGYAFANINPIPEIDEARREVSLDFQVEPGRRTYINRIELSGHDRTRDEVLRRELRQMESGWVSTSRVKRSRTRLDRLGFFDSVDVKMPPVPGSADQVDLAFDVVERNAFGNLSAGIGYSSADGMLVNASVTEENFFGTGQRFSISANNSELNTVYSFSFTEPYADLDGTSRTLNFSYSESDTGAIDVVEYTTDTYTLGLIYGMPIGEYDTYRYGFNYDLTTLNTDANTSQHIIDFCDDQVSRNDCQFDVFNVTNGWIHDTRNRAIFPNAGGKLNLNSIVALPFTDAALNFYKVSLSHQHYFPVLADNVLSLFGEMAYADVYGNSHVLAPFERYYAGGINSIRGFRSRTVGSEGTFDEAGEALGGNTRLLLRSEFLFPPPFEDNEGSMRFGLFVDGGNTFNRDYGVDVADLRYSAGVSLAWITPIGPLKFSYGQPLNRKDDDEVESFQFTIGQP
ncbi:MAG: outer membrane protein assembly factor BamA [Gammaproteobacteria bacterium]|nr:outer membrane protein assembly factor BamA [Gammaproteobacteria bacterium]